MPAYDFLGAVPQSVAVMATIFYKLGVDAAIGSRQQRLLVTPTSLASAIDGDAIAAVPLDSTTLSPLHLDLLARFEEVDVQDREFVRETFGRYISQDVARLLLDQRVHTELEGEERVVTVLISEIRAYSTISERIPAAQVVDMLSCYHSDS